MQIAPEQITRFREMLLNWYATSHRPMPWKGEKDPYLIWLSEIILQQTRVEQGLPYFERFREAYPTVHDLAGAPEDEVMKHWEGLGYYSRARNLHATAKHIAYERGGHFPDSHAEILALKGVGPYTAAAIASFAFNLPHAVVDGNVFRVLTRFFGISEPTDTTQGKKRINELAAKALDETQPGTYNQAIMDFGATRCVPQSPDCSQCPMQPDCVAFQKNMVDQLPVKSKKLVRRERYFHYLILLNEGNTLVRKRTGQDIWQNLYEFPLIEQTKAAAQIDHLKKELLWQRLIGDQSFRIIRASKSFKQTLTHQVIHAVFWEIELQGDLQAKDQAYIIAKRKNLRKFAFPKIIDWYLQDNSLYLNLH